MWREGWSLLMLSLSESVGITALPPLIEFDKPGRPFTSGIHPSDESVKEILDNILIQHEVRIWNSHWDSELTKFCPSVWHYGALLLRTWHGIQHHWSLGRVCIWSFFLACHALLKLLFMLFGTKYFQCIAWALFPSFQCFMHHKWITTHFHCIACWLFETMCIVR